MTMGEMIVFRFIPNGWHIFGVWFFGVDVFFPLRRRDISPSGASYFAHGGKGGKFRLPSRVTFSSAKKSPKRRRGIPPVPRTAAPPYLVLRPALAHRLGVYPLAAARRCKGQIAASYQRRLLRCGRRQNSRSLLSAKHSGILVCCYAKNVR